MICKVCKKDSKEKKDFYFRKNGTGYLASSSCRECISKSKAEKKATESATEGMFNLKDFAKHSKY